MSDVSAAVLSIGEASVSRALESVSRQSHPLHEVIVVENVTPFHRALNEAARRVSAPFFLQVDADMILDRTCVESLRAAMDDGTGVVCGELRDPLIGQVVGIKLFRVACVRQIGFQDSVSPDTDFIKAMERAGWQARYVGRSPLGSDVPASTYGEHRPDYTPAYTFRKYLFEGRRYRYRGAREGLFSKIERLDASEHRLGLFAQIALAHGFFLPTDRDELKPVPADPRAGWLVDLLDSGTQLAAGLGELFPLERHRRLRDVFRRFATAGREISTARTGGTAKDAIARLKGGRRDRRALVARLALGHGVLAPNLEDPRRAADERALKAFVCLGIAEGVTPREHLRAHAARLYNRIRCRRPAAPW